MAFVNPLAQVQKNTQDWLKKTQPAPVSPYKPETITPAKPENSQPQQQGTGWDTPAVQTAPVMTGAQKDEHDQRQLQETTQKQNYQPITSNFAGVGAYIGANTGRVAETLNKYYSGAQDAGQSTGESRLSAAVAQQGNVKYGKGTEDQLRAQAAQYKGILETPEAVQGAATDAVNSGQDKATLGADVARRAAANQASVDRWEREARVNEALRTGNVEKLAGETQNSLLSQDYRQGQQAIVDNAYKNIMSGITGEVGARRDAAVAAADAAQGQSAEAVKNPEIIKRVNEIRSLLGKPALTDKEAASTSFMGNHFDAEINSKIKTAENDLKKLQKSLKNPANGNLDQYGSNVRADKQLKQRLKETQDYINALRQAQAGLVETTGVRGAAVANRDNTGAEAARLRSAYERLA